MSATLTAMALVAAAAVALGGCADDDGRDEAGAAPPAKAVPARASPPVPPAEAAAVVGDKAIGERELKRRLASLSRARQRAGMSARGLRPAILSDLLLRETLEQELLRRGSSVPIQAVQERWRTQRQRLAREGGLERFMAGRTLGSVLLALRIELLRKTIHELVAEEDRQRPERAIARFEYELPARWSHATVCRSAYGGPACAP